MTAIYNEIEAYPSAWLRNLITAGHIAPGIVDERSIIDLSPEDVREAMQAHFFAGLGVWSHALRLAGWPDERPVWTGSCPCQPFSAAGRGRGLADERHLWPEWFRLIRECRPPVIFGEQVSSVGVVGPRVPDSRVQEVQDREAVLGVLRELKGQSAMDVHRMREAVLEEEQARQRDENKGSHESVEGRATGIRAGQRGTTSRKGQGDGIRSGSAGDTGTNRCRDMRADRDSLRHEDSVCVERTVTGSHRPESRVHDGKRPGSAVRSERDGERMGRRKDSGGRGRDQKSTANTLNGLLEDAWGPTQEASEWAWIDVVRSDLESIGYTVGICVLPAAGVGAPHIRQRLYFVAVAGGERFQGVGVQLPEREPRGSVSEASRRSAVGELSDVRSEGLEVRGKQPPRRELEAVERGRSVGELADRASDRRQERRRQAGEQWSGSVVDGSSGQLGDASRARGGRDAGAVPGAQGEGSSERRGAGRVADLAGTASAARGMADTYEPDGVDGREQGGRGLVQSAPHPTAGFWANADWIACRDGKARPVEPGTFPLAHGVAGRVGKLRAYGNAICAPLAAEFIASVMECM